MKLFIALASCLLASIVASSPLGYGRPRRGYTGYSPSPQQGMMFGGFYGNPYQGQASMSAFAHKDMVATNSFAGEEYPQVPQVAPIHYPSEPEPEPTITESSNVDFEEELDLEPLPSTTVKSVKPKKRKPSTTTRRPQLEVDADEDDDEQSWPFAQRGGGQTPSFNNFFPMMFGGHGGSTRNGNGYPPGGATAIANSFSTGKGGVASSHATAYGDPYFSMNAKRKQNGNHGNDNHNNKQD